MQSMAEELPPYCAPIAHRVEHPDRWKAGFDGLERERRDAGILGHHINRARDDPQLITVFLPLADLDRATSFTSAYVRRQGDAAQGGVFFEDDLVLTAQLRSTLHRS